MVPLTLKLFSRCVIFTGDGGVNGVPGERGTFYPHGKLAHPRHHPQFLNIIREGAPAESIMEAMSRAADKPEEAKE